ncbi:MAG: ABC transporter substrate-binding protein [Desulfobacteraceae bacterium]|nr:ABC transporter substrate-binding protein [Desulfobacteraceae bacterium]MBC2750117.1 ABC transporter substrate-binding protein [Desulfobacteraceae bacterium]
MKRKYHRLWIVAMAVGLALAFMAPVQAAETYQLGLSLAITGPTSDAGNPYSKGAEDYIRFVNETKVLGDAKVDCPIRDDMYETAVTKRNFEDFLDQEMVLFLSYATGANQALAQDFNEVKIPVIPASMDKSLVGMSEYIFLPIASYSHQYVGVAEYVAKNHKGGGVPKVAAFIHPSAFGRAPLEDFKAAVAAGLKLDLVEVVEHGKDLDNSALLQRLQSKGVQYVLCQTVQSPVATLLNDAQRLGMTAASFGEAGKITFMGAHYTGGNDLISLAGSAAEGYYWTTAYHVTSEKGPWTDWQLDMAKKYERDDKTANSHNYACGMMAAQVAVEAIRRTREAGQEVTSATLYETLNQMNGDKAFESLAAVGPVTYGPGDHMGVDTVQLYVVKDGAFQSEGEPFKPEFIK